MLWERIQNVTGCNRNEELLYQKEFEFAISQRIPFRNFTRYKCFFNATVSCPLFPFVVVLLLYFRPSFLWFMFSTGNTGLPRIPCALFRCLSFPVWSVLFYVSATQVAWSFAWFFLLLLKSFCWHPETTMVHDLGCPQVCTSWNAWFQAIPSCAIIISVEFGLENLRREIPTHTCAGSRLCIVPTRRRVKCVSPILWLLLMCGVRTV